MSHAPAGDRPGPADPAVYAPLFEHAPCGYLVTTQKGRILRVNETFEHMTGYSRAELVGSSFVSILTVGSRLFHETRHLPALMLRRQAGEISLSILCADGSELSTLMNSVVAGDGDEAELRMAVFDSTERHDYERELLTARRAAEASEKQLALVHRASNAFTIAETEEELATALATNMRDAFSASHSAVLLIDGDSLRLAAGNHPLRESTRSDVSTPETEAVRLGQVVTFVNPDAAESEHPGLGTAFAAARVAAVSAAPLIDKGAVAGVVVSFFGRERQFDAAAVELHEILTAQAAHALTRIRLQEQLTQLALLDQLTGLANRKFLQLRLNQTLAASARNGRALSLVFLDLDGFKVVNDHCGHDVGDAVLEEVADRLRASVRTGDTIARYGGDEFVVVCEEADADDAAVVADRIRASISEPLTSAPPEFVISASVGVAVLGADCDAEVTPDGILRLADAAMYQSKNAGKDRVTVVHVDRTHPPLTGSLPVQR
ncbi:MAG: diguanylate cyclase [Mycetocola sp.]